MKPGLQPLRVGNGCVPDQDRLIITSGQYGNRNPEHRIGALVDLPQTMSSDLGSMYLNTPTARGVHPNYNYTLLLYGYL